MPSELLGFRRFPAGICPLGGEGGRKALDGGLGGLCFFPSFSPFSPYSP